MSQFLPKINGFYRAVSLGPNGDLEPRLGNCGAAAAFVSTPQRIEGLYKLTIDFAGFSGFVNPDLADNDGRSPIPLASLNTSLVIEARSGNSPIYVGWSGDPQSETKPGTIRVQLGDGSPTLAALNAFVLCDMRDGTREYIVFFTAGCAWSQITSGVKTLTNRAYHGGPLVGLPGDSQGTATIRAHANPNG